MKKENKNTDYAFLAGFLALIGQIVFLYYAERVKPALSDEISREHRAEFEYPTQKNLKGLTSAEGQWHVRPNMAYAQEPYQWYEYLVWGILCQTLTCIGYYILYKKWKERKRIG